MAACSVQRRIPLSAIILHRKGILNKEDRQSSPLSFWRLQKLLSKQNFRIKLAELWILLVMGGVAHR